MQPYVAAKPLCLGESCRYLFILSLSFSRGYHHGSLSSKWVFVISVLGWEPAIACETCELQRFTQLVKFIPRKFENNLSFHSNWRQCLKKIFFNIISAISGFHSNGKGVSLWGISLEREGIAPLSKPHPVNFQFLKIQRTLACCVFVSGSQNLGGKRQPGLLLKRTGGLGSLRGTSLSSQAKPSEEWLTASHLVFIYKSKWMNAWSEPFHLF